MVAVRAALHCSREDNVTFHLVRTSPRLDRMSLKCGWKIVKAVQAADLVDTLSGPGAFTVFASSETRSKRALEQKRNS